MPDKTIYIEQDPQHYFDAANSANPIQRFWHRHKFSTAAKEAHSSNGQRVLDCGCGSGTLLPFIPESMNVTVMDISAKNVAFTKKLRKGVRGIVGSSDKKIGKEKFDTIFFIEVIEHIEPAAEMPTLKNFYNALAPGGTLVVTTPNYHSMWPLIEKVWNRINPIDYAEQHINRHHPSSLAASLQKTGFTNVTVRTFFVFSPFVALLSARLAQKVARIEEKLLPWAGNIVIARATKP